MWQVYIRGTTLKNQPNLRFYELSAQEFITEYLGASEVTLDMDGEGEIEVVFHFTHIDQDDGERDDALEIASLRPKKRLQNIQQLAHAMRNTFPETGYPK